MATEKYANNPSSTLNGGINSAVTSFTLNSAATFPTTGQFRVLIGTEIIIVGTVAGNVCSSCTRGAENTTPASHLNGDAVTFIYTAGSIINNPRSMQSTGDIEYLNSSGAPTRLPAPADGNYALAFASGIPSYINQSSLSGIPTGTILPYGGITAPAGFYLCDGSAKSRAGDATLFGIISTTFGVGDGATTFNIPDLRNRFPLGAGNAATLGTSGGVLQHTHTISASGGLDLLSGGSASSIIGLDTPSKSILGQFAAVWYSIIAAVFGGAPDTFIAAQTHSHGGVTGTAIPANQVVNYIIKN